MVTNYESDRIAGCLVSHEHGDHARRTAVHQPIHSLLYAGYCRGLQLRNRFEPDRLQADGDREKLR